MPAGGVVRGYHKPIMVAGGVGNLRAPLALKSPIPPGALLVQLGGPGMLIGMGGGAASSLEAGANVADLDFDSVQRGNAEIQRRAQEVIDACSALGASSPVLSIHDVGAGGLSNALPELAHGAGQGRDDRSPRRAERRARHDAARGVVQRGAGALRARDSARPSRRVPRDLRAGAVPVRRRRHGDGRRPPGGRRSAVRQPAGRRRPRRDPRQAAEDGPRRTARRAAPAGARSARRRAGGGLLPRAPRADRREQGFPRHDRRPYRRRPVRARPDGRAVAGAGRRLRGDARGLQPVTRARRSRSASARRSRSSTPRPRAGWRSARR